MTSARHISSPQSDPMSVVVNIADELKEWIERNLDRGCSPAALVRSMVAQRFEPALAQALVAAFVNARLQGAAPRTEGLALDVDLPQDRNEGPRVAPGTLIRTLDRDIPVLLRAQRPVLAVLEAVLSNDECDRLIAFARPRLRPSTVVDPHSGETVVAPHRDSAGMFFEREENDFIAKLDRRIAQIMGCPLENGEGLQILRYGSGAQSAPHFDFLLPCNDANRASIARSGQRISTLVIYLNEVVAGGETVFPEVGLAVTPRKGNAVYFEYTNSRGELDHDSAHAGAPVLAGEKWAATKWMRERRFVPG